jgi:hypothetical protein
MTLGEFRKITEQYGDDCQLFYSKNASNLFDRTRVDRVIIDIREASDEPEPRLPEIIVL